MKKNKKLLLAALSLLAAFAAWTGILCLVDVKPIGPGDSAVGLAMLNGFVHNLTGANFSLYTLTDWLGLVPIGICMTFGILGLAQWIKGKSIRKVDFSLLVLGGFYLVTIGVYLLFEQVVINYRPVLIHGILEVSYPSSTTLLTMCVMPTAMLQVRERVKNKRLCNVTLYGMGAFTGFMVIGRLLSGVHWITDIIGGLLLSAGLVCLYASVSKGK